MIEVNYMVVRLAPITDWGQVESQRENILLPLTTRAKALDWLEANPCVPGTVQVAECRAHDSSLGSFVGRHWKFRRWLTVDNFIDDAMEPNEWKCGECELVCNVKHQAVCGRCLNVIEGICNECFFRQQQGLCWNCDKELQARSHPLRRYAR